MNTLTFRVNDNRLVNPAMFRPVPQLLIVILLGCSGAHPVERGKGSEIPRGSTSEFAYTARRNGRLGIYLRSGDSDRLLTAAFKSAEAPVWSPDGRKIAFHSKDRGNWDIHVTDIGSGKATRLTSHKARDTQPAWSPDGKTIAFMSDRGNREMGDDIYLMNADGSNVRRLTRGIDGTKDPAWSPDGKSIAFSGPASRGPRLLRDASDIKPDTFFEDIYIAKRDGTGTRKLTNGKAVSILPAWSPDGKQIAFSSNQHGNTGSLLDLQIHIINVNGSGLRRLTKFKAVNLCPSWSPHKTKILFHSNTPLPTKDPWKVTSELYVVNADGTGLKQLTSNVTDDYFPAWRPAVGK